MKKQISMLHKGRVHLFWTGGQSAALCQQPKPTHNSPKDDYANASQPSYFPRNRRRAPSRSCNCLAVMWKNKQVFFFSPWRQSAFIKGTTTICVRYKHTRTHTNTHNEKTWKKLKCILLLERRQSEKLYTIWLQLYDISENTKVWRHSKDQWLLAVESGAWGSENTQYDIIMIVTFLNIFVMCNTKSEP